MPRPLSTLEADPVLVHLTDPKRTGTRPSPLPLRPPGLIRRTLAVKRAFDYSLAAVLLVLTAPVVARAGVLLAGAGRPVRPGVHHLQAQDHVPPVRAAHGAEVERPRRPAGDP